MASAAKSLDGTVSFIHRDGIEIDIGGDVTLRVDGSRIPAELHRFGQPIRLTLRADGSVGFAARPLRPVAPLPGEAEIDAWIAGLPE